MLIIAGNSPQISHEWKDRWLRRPADHLYPIPPSCPGLGSRNKKLVFCSVLPAILLTTHEYLGTNTPPRSKKPAAAPRWPPGPCQNWRITPVTHMGRSFVFAEKAFLYYSLVRFLKPPGGHVEEWNVASYYFGWWCNSTKWYNWIRQNARIRCLFY